uniref:YHS domain-containing protein n=1 Tax=Pararhizobium sp. IMCC3301 TaxID=3067904 RepID=UPI0027407D42|nr:YHS domain-containing protein [Pararhizobium sp. IMCC3301]
MTGPQKAFFVPDKAIIVTDPVCGKDLALEHAAAHIEYEDWAYFFCSKACHDTFLSSPQQYASGHAPSFSAPANAQK